MKTKTPDLRISAISDVHVLHFGPGEKQFTNALRFHAEKLPKSDLYVFGGDIVYQLDNEGSVCTEIHEGAYDFVLGEVGKYLPAETPRIYLLGNHEFPQSNTDETLTAEAFDVWERKFGQPACDHTVVNGYHFIKTPVRSWKMEQCQADEAYAMRELNAALAADPDKPVFYLSHDSAPRTVACSYRAGSLSEDFRAFLTKRPRIVHISGHHHTHFLDERVIWQEGFTSVSLPVAAVGFIDTVGVPPVSGYSQSMYFEVFGRQILVHRIDLTVGEEIGEPFCIDLDELDRGQARYGADRAENAPRPRFAEGTDISVSVDEENVGLSFAQAFVPIPGAASFEEFPRFYRILVKDAAGNVCENRLISSDFYKLSHKEPMDARCKVTLKKPVQAGDYTVIVVPQNSFLAGEDGISCTFRV